MHQFEGFTCAKNPQAPETNEDQLVVRAGEIYAVVDGATDISGKRHDDVLGRDATGGRLAARAVAAALSGLSGGPLLAPPEPGLVLDATRAAVAALHARLGLGRAAEGSADLRFRAAFAAAFVAGDTVRLLRVGDCGIRIDGQRVLRHEFPGDVVLSAARAEAWALLGARQVPADERRAAVRRLIVAGLVPGRPVPETGLDAGDLQHIAEAVVARPEVMAAVGGDRSLLDRLLAAGLSGIRAASAGFGALVVDGVSDVTPAAEWLDLPLAAIDTLEIFSDGYPSEPEAVSIEAWEDSLARIDAEDPDRIGAHPATKGRNGRHFADDRSILILRTLREGP